MADKIYCKECDKSFKALTGLMGHNQWKHNKLADGLVSNNPSSKTVIMLEKMTDQIEELKDVIEELKDEIIDLGKDFSRLQSGNGNGNGPVPPAPAPERELRLFNCLNCKTDLKFKQAYCPGCGQVVDWSSVKSAYA